MLYRTFLIGLVTVVLCLGICSRVSSRIKVPVSAKTDLSYDVQSASSLYCRVNHRIGKMVLAVGNYGTIGVSTIGDELDCFTGEQIVTCEYPKGSNTMYLFQCGFWIGAVVGRDTLVSEGCDAMTFATEFTPSEEDLSEVIRRSISTKSANFSLDAKSEEDWGFKYHDTEWLFIPPDWYTGRRHIPLNIEVTQSSYAWSYSYAEDFILFDYSIRNIGLEPLEEVYMGIYVDGDVFALGGEGSGDLMLDDICGCLRVVRSDWMGCTFSDTVNIAWIADNDGDPVGGEYTDQSVPHVTGTRIVRTPADTLRVSFNWWCNFGDYITMDFGPRERGEVGLWPEPFRDFGTGGIGSPVGDANTYYQMKNQEFDYDQIYTNTISKTDPLWIYPNQELADDLSDGYDTRYLLSFGPFDIDPGETLPLSFAFVAGENFHTDPTNGENLPYNPDLYYKNVDLTDLAINADWAAKVYDNPGVDTDGDGYSGKVRVCCDDGRSATLYSTDSLASVGWYDTTSCKVVASEGDGVPDYCGASPPPGPEFWLQADNGGIRVRINGMCSETARDLFTGVPDFEGYRVYIGRDERESSYSIVASYDVEDYNKYVWTGYYYELIDIPYTLDSLRCLYGSSCDDTLFRPLVYTRENPFRHPEFSDSVFYFERQDFNASELGTQTPITKIYPDQPYPSSLNPDSAHPSELTEDGYFKYFEYEIRIDGLLRTVPYWVSVTAFDFGSPIAGLLSMESALTLGAKTAYADVMTDEVTSQELKAYVYPNPYRSDAEYRDNGYEGRTDFDRPDYRVRQINFANLPAKCTIRIYSLDGDLIREIDHDCDPGDPTASHESWNMITRNTQLVVSGLYYWIVEAEDGSVQLGKLVIVL